jgi:hypothetical protein
MTSASSIASEGALGICSIGNFQLSLNTIEIYKKLFNLTAIAQATATIKTSKKTFIFILDLYNVPRSCQNSFSIDTEPLAMKLMTLYDFPSNYQPQPDQF